ncbi:zinc finger and BTB domain-containing protein 11-like isoform X2 [Carcharodon carcharias]|uniref:zinc finger and BTB domain-containing protein 11-like isoform X2 n=1 Tax=Carcharodon carcharias TaxID=13397 RepID=UPI001B7DDA67|nr:zinc finger and BTB domain-containing protein 11-like isoform X2 [Carcharodon carcharias]
MTSAENYRAIVRYLTHRKQPYAAGTAEHTKRAIRKAAACYVFRDGLLFYQRRRRDSGRLDELEVVVEEPRRREIFRRCHISRSGRHYSREITGINVSSGYWWRGILSQISQFVKQCEVCRSGADKICHLSEDLPADLEIGQETVKREEASAARPNQNNLEDHMGAQHIQGNEKHFTNQHSHQAELQRIVKQTSTGHSRVVLDQLNEQRNLNKFCDIALLIEGEEYRAHKSVLAANSKYFQDLFTEKGATASQEAVVELAGFAKPSFLPLLDFCYTSCLTIEMLHLVDIISVAEHLKMEEVISLCKQIQLEMEIKEESCENRSYNSASKGYACTSKQIKLSTSKAANQKAFGKESALISQLFELPIKTGDKCSIVGGNQSHRVDERGSIVNKDQKRFSWRGSDNGVALQAFDDEDYCVAMSDDENAKTNVENQYNHRAQNPEVEVTLGMDCISANDDNFITGSLKRSGVIRPVNQKAHQKRLKRWKHLAIKSLTKMKDGNAASFTCTECGESFQSAWNLQKHVELHGKTKGFKCAICNKSFAYIHILKLHLKYHQDAKDYRCELCGKEHSNASSLWYHKLAHSDELQYCCILCGKRFKTPSGYNRHKKKHHLSEETFPYNQCDTCGKVFCDCKRTRRAHCEDRPRISRTVEHVCEHCDKIFNQIEDYRKHMTQHTGLKPFQCLTCGLSWADPRSLRHHIREHTGEKPYICSICRDPHIDARSLRLHMKKLHGNAVPKRITLKREPLPLHKYSTRLTHDMFMSPRTDQKQEDDSMKEIKQ